MREVVVEPGVLAEQILQRAGECKTLVGATLDKSGKVIKNPDYLDIVHLGIFIEELANLNGSSIDIVYDHLDQKRSNLHKVFTQGRGKSRSVGSSTLNHAMAIVIEHFEVPTLIFVSELLRYCIKNSISVSGVDKYIENADIVLSAADLLEADLRAGDEWKFNHIKVAGGSSLDGLRSLLDNQRSGHTNDPEENLGIEDILDPSEQRRIDRLVESATFDRQTIASLISDTLEQKDYGYITINGPPGSGKSSLLASAVHRYSQDSRLQLFVFFIDYTFAQQSWHVTAELTRQVFRAIPDMRESLEARLLRMENSGVLDRSLLVDLLEYASRSAASRKILFIVDALDELDYKDRLESDNLQPHLALPAKLPNSIFFLLSSRAFRDVSLLGETKIGLTLENEMHRNDLMGYVADYLDEQNVLDWIDEQDWEESISQQTQFVDLMVERSEGSFLYLSMVLENLKSYKKDGLPSGLQEYYSEQTKRLLLGDRSSRIARRRILSAMARYSTYEGLPIEHVAHYSGEPVDVVYEMAEFWSRLRIIQIDSEVDGIYLKFFHKSFVDFLAKDKSLSVVDLERDRSRVLLDALVRETDDQIFVFKGLVRESERLVRISEENFVRLCNELDVPWREVFFEGDNEVCLYNMIHDPHYRRDEPQAVWKMEIGEEINLISGYNPEMFEWVRSRANRPYDDDE